MRITLISFGLLLVPGIPARAQTALTMGHYHPRCHEGADLRGDDCVAAAHRLCEDTSSKISFGFAYQRDGRSVYVACAQRGWYGAVAWGRLQQFHPGCRSAADGQSPACVAAVRRYCTDEMSMSGGLIQEVGVGTAAVACFKAARYTDVEYQELAQFSRECFSPNAAGGLGCVTAAARWCRAGNPSELGLPQEVGPRSIAVACLPASVHVVDLGDRPQNFDDNR